MLGKKDRMMDGSGRYRTRGVDGGSDLAFVVDKSISFQVGERLYRSRGYSPPFDQLPWELVESGR